MVRFGLQRGQCYRRAPIVGPDADDAYVEALAAWQIEQGLNTLDLTPSQTERFRAVERAHGDLRMACGLIFQRRRYRSGRLTDAIR